MAYVVFSFHGEEIGRRELHGPVVIGRSPECTLVVHDILLSRHHCKLEPVNGGKWAAVDLGSKNGTMLRGRAITRHLLGDGDVLRIGHTQVAFFAGAFIAEPKANEGSKMGVIGVRPKDPHEALSGTVSGMVLPDDETEAQAVGAAAELAMPTPKPKRVKAPSMPLTLKPRQVAVSTPSPRAQEMAIEALAAVTSGSMTTMLQAPPVVIRSGKRRRTLLALAVLLALLCGVMWTVSYWGVFG